MTKRTWTTLLLATLTLGISSLACANSGYMTLFNDTYSNSSLKNNCMVCHTSVPSLNPYGTAFMTNGHNLTAIGSQDSDGDGFSNADEISAGTSPGDPASKPAPPAPPPPSISDTIPPTVTSFSIPSTSSSLTISITALGAEDNVGVTGYMVTESATKPGPGDPGWSASPPASYTFSSAGAKTLYAWAKDAAGNVSQNLSAPVTITGSSTAEDMTLWIGKWFKVTEKNTGYHFDSSALNKSNAAYIGYLKFYEWDPANKILRGDRYGLDTGGQWTSEPLTLHYLAGSDLDFLCWAQETGDTIMGFTARIKGQKSNGELVKATFKTLGGYYLDASNDGGSGAGSTEFWAGALSVTGVLIPEAEAPVPGSVLIH